MANVHYNRNLILFAAIVALQYLAAPVIYVGITQASLLNQLGANPIIANLPGASFFVMASMVACIAWLFPGVRHLKPILTTCYALCAVTCGLTSMVLISDTSDETKVIMVILQSGITGATIPTAIAFIWEILGRTTDESKRGLALGFAYGLGPVLAALGSLASQLILAGHFELGPLKWTVDTYEAPLNFGLLFALETPAMLLASVLASRFQIPAPKQDVLRKPVSEVADLATGIAASVAAMGCTLGGQMSLSVLFMLVATLLYAWHFRDLLSVRLLRMVTIMTFVFYIGNVIPSNMNLYSKEVLGVDPQEYAGYQNLMRFSFKAVAGLFLGWLLVQTNPRTGVLITASLYLLALIWALFASGSYYLFAFGIFGAGELVGVYAPNYMLSACRESEMKRGQVLMNLLMGPVGQFGIIFGWIAATIQKKDLSLLGQDSQAFGFQVSFFICALILVSGILYTLKCLPREPHQARAHPG